MRKTSLSFLVVALVAAASLTPAEALADPPRAQAADKRFEKQLGELSREFQKSLKPSTAPSTATPASPTSSEPSPARPGVDYGEPGPSYADRAMNRPGAHMSKNIEDRRDWDYGNWKELGWDPQGNQYFENGHGKTFKKTSDGTMETSEVPRATIPTLEKHPKWVVEPPAKKPTPPASLSQPKTASPPDRDRQGGSTTPSRSSNNTDRDRQGGSTTPSSPSNNTDRDRQGGSTTPSRSSNNTDRDRQGGSSSTSSSHASPSNNTDRDRQGGSSSTSSSHASPSNNTDRDRQGGSSSTSSSHASPSNNTDRDRQGGSSSTSSKSSSSSSSSSSKGPSGRQ